MNEGQYIYTQVTQLVPRQIFQRLVKKYGGDYRVREFNCTNQLKYMLFGQLMPCDSLRDICLCLGRHKQLLYGLGITTSVNESTLSRANESSLEENLDTCKHLVVLAYWVVSTTK